MSTQSWTITGIVIGAVLGGGAQAFADFLASRRQSRTSEVDLRREVYRTVLSAFRRLDVSILVARRFYEEMHADDAKASSMEHNAQLITLTDRVMADVAVLREAVAFGDLDASVEVHERIGSTYTLCLKLAVPTGLRRWETFPWDDTKDMYRDAFRNMRAQMRREVGREALPDTELVEDPVDGVGA
ncbi:MAG TPA: hypothetical protein VFK41_01870 [Nocardioidaceae bacterium]|nr:hypothetical protein [Nocardioidaceae bacterium]